MEINSKEIIAGHPILKIRDFLRWAKTGLSFNIESVKYKLHINNAHAKKVIIALQELGYIAASKHSSGNNQRLEVTQIGCRLSLSSAAPKVSLHTADSTMKEFLKRVEKVKSDAYFLYKVTEITLFGSYLSRAEKVGDIDLIIEVAPKEKDKGKHNTLCEKRTSYLSATGRRFNSYIDALGAAETETIKFLQSRSRIINLHNSADKELNTAMRIIYRDTKKLSKYKR